MAESEAILYKNRCSVQHGMLYLDGDQQDRRYRTWRPQNSASASLRLKWSRSRPRATSPRSWPGLATEVTGINGRIDKLDDKLDRRFDELTRKIDTLARRDAGYGV